MKKQEYCRLCGCSLDTDTDEGVVYNVRTTLIDGTVYASKVLCYTCWYGGRFEAAIIARRNVGLAVLAKSMLSTLGTNKATLRTIVEAG